MFNLLKGTLALTVVLLCGSLSAQNVLFSEDFEGNNGNAPSGWTTTQAANSVGWEFGDDNALESQFFPLGENTEFACTNDDKHDVQGGGQNDASEDRLITPVVDFTGIDAVLIQFDYVFRTAGGEQARVERSTDGGSTWTLVQSLPSTGGAWSNTVVYDADAAGLSNVQYAFRYDDDGEWGYGFAIDDVEIFEPLPNDVRLVSVTNELLVKPGLYDVTGVLQNRGSQPLTSVMVSWSTDGGATYNHDLLTGLNVDPWGTINFTHAVGIDMVTPNLYELEVKLSDPNGAVDSDMSNNELERPVSSVGTRPGKYALLEEFTGAWCQYCPDGQLIVEQILNSRSDVFATGVHIGDDMETNQSLLLNAIFADGWPSGMVDRTRYPNDDNAGISRGGWANRVASQVTNALTCASLSATSTYNAGTRTFTADLTTEFTTRASGEYYRMSVLVVEDSVTGTGQGYDQVNFYNNQAGHPFAGAGNPIVGYPHAHVLRAYVNNVWGDSASLPAIIEPNTPYSKQFQFQLPPAWDVTQIKLIAVVQQHNPDDFYENIVLNAVEVELTGNGSTPGTSSTLTADNGVIATEIGLVSCNGAADGSATVTGVANGATGAYTYTWSDGGNGATRTGLTAGNYTVTMNNGSGVTAATTVKVGEPLALTVTETVSQTIAGGNVTLEVSGGSAPYTYSWDSGETVGELSGLDPGTYTVTVTDANNCTASKTITITGGTGINNAGADFEVSLFPNPASEFVNISATFENAAEVTIEVYNTAGSQVIVEELGQKATVDAQLNIAALENGVYFVRVKAGNEVQVKSIVVQQ